MIYYIPRSNMYKLNNDLTKLNRKAVKLGLTPIKFEVIGEVDEFFVIETNDVEPIQIKGWSLVAIIESIENGNLIKNVPGAGDIPTKFRSTEYSECEHCHTKRQRSNLFVLRNGEEYKQVGRTCLQDFFATDPHAMLEAASLYAKFYDTLNDKEPYNGKNEKIAVTFSTHQIVTLACAISRKHGYVSKRAAMEYGKESTASTIDWILNSHTRSEIQCVAQYVKDLDISDTDKEKADKIIAWAKDMPRDINNDYMYNLGVAFRSMYTTSSSFGFVVSAVEAYRKEFEKEEPKEEKKNNSQWIGTEGDKIKVDAKVVRIVRGGNDWGATTMIELEEKDTGNVLVWWASGYKVPVMNEVFTITGTVKSHTKFNEIQQTVITRVKGIEEQSAVSE